MALLCKRPIFIVGEGRSGTTMLRNLLAEHKNIWAIERESYIFVTNWPQKNPYFEKYQNDLNKLSLAVIAAMKRVGVKAQKALQEKEIAADIRSAHQAFLGSSYYKNLESDFNHIKVFDSVCKFFSELDHAERIIEKTPYHINYIKEILDAYPDAQIIAIYRDPRAVIASWLKKDKFKSILGCCHSWNNAMSKISSYTTKLDESQIQLIKFEDLISEPESSLKKLCSWLGEDFDPALLKEQKVNSSFDDSQSSGFILDNKARWQKSLNESQINLIDYLCHKHYSSYQLETFRPQKNIFSRFSFILDLSFEYLRFPLVKFVKSIQKFI